MRVREHDAVGRWKSGKIVAAFGELVRALAIGRPVLGDCLVERHQRSATAMGEQHDLGDAGLPAQQRHPGFHVERQLLEIDQRLVVLVTRVHAQHEEAAARQLGAGAVIEIVRGAMHREEGNMGRRAGIGPIERALADARKRDELRIGLGVGNAGHEAECEPGQNCSRDGNAQHGCPPVFLRLPCRRKKPPASSGVAQGRPERTMLANPLAWDHRCGRIAGRCLGAR